MYGALSEKARELKSKNPILDRAVAECLVELVRARGAAVTYRELADSVGERLQSWDPERSGIMHPLGLRYPLDRMQKYCKDIGLPVLPAMVVGKATHVPGAGFETAYRKWFPEDHRDISEVASENQAKCLEGPEWEKLLSVLNRKGETRE